MEMAFQAALGIVICAAIAAVIVSVKGMLLTPVRRRADADIFAVISARNGAEGLEQTVRGLMWLSDSGKADMCVVIVDDGMDPQAKMRACRLAEKCGGAVCAPDNINEVIEEYRWTHPDTR